MPDFERAELLAFLRRERYAVQSSVSPDGAPQAALVGFIVTDRLELFFDTLASSRKAANLRANGRAAFVIGPTDASAVRTVQLEGVADEPQGEELARLLECYLAKFPDGKERQEWPGIVYFRVRPTWLRNSDFSRDPPAVTELTGRELLEFSL